MSFDIRVHNKTENNNPVEKQFLFSLQSVYFVLRLNEIQQLDKDVFFSQTHRINFNEQLLEIRVAVRI